MLSSRFIVLFFALATLLAWMIPDVWMEERKAIPPVPNSPWSSVVSLDDVVWGGGSPYVRISVNDLDAPIFLSGWSLENERKERAEIGLGTEFFSMESVPHLEKIRVASGTSLLVSFSASPVGVSFRENACSGYLRGTDPFVPPVEDGCPDLSEYPEWKSLDGTCQLLIASLPKCRVISPEHAGDMSSACGSFLRTKASYPSCMARVGDGSMRPLWRIFISGRETFITESGGVVILKDDRGLVVDSLPYETIGIK
jgi:hypothetical protein